MSQDFLRNIFSRGSYARTDGPAVVVGGVDNQSATLTHDVMHFSGGAILVHTVNSQAASGTTTVSGQVTIAGVPSVNVASWGGSAVLSATAGVPTVGWFQRLDATNDAILAYGQARTTDPAAASVGSATPVITDTLGKQVVLPGAVNDRHLDGAVEFASIATQTLIANQGAGQRIALQSLLATNSGSATVRIIVSGGPNNRTFGFAPPGGGFQINGGGAALYLTSASSALSVAADVTATCIVFASGYSLSN